MHVPLYRVHMLIFFWRVYIHTPSTKMKEFLYLRIAVCTLLGLAAVELIVLALVTKKPKKPKKPPISK